MEFRELQDALAQFAHEREWEQFHSPKNLVMALSGEAGELSEIFQWLTPEAAATVMDDPELAANVRAEMADVLAYLLRLADVLGVDLADALRAKIVINAERYPIGLAKGRITKYDRLSATPK